MNFIIWYLNVALCFGSCPIEYWFLSNTYKIEKKLLSFKMLFYCNNENVFPNILLFMDHDKASSSGSIPKAWSCFQTVQITAPLEVPGALWHCDVICLAMDFQS